MENLLPDFRLLESLKSGSPAAFASLYRDYFRMVEDLVHRLGGSGADAQDVFQETLLVLVKKLREPGFQLTSKLSTYLYAIARNIWLKRAGKAGNEIPFENQDLTLNFKNLLPDEEQPPQEKEVLLEVMTEKLAQLEEGCRTLLLLSFYENLPHAEIARRMSYSEAFVKVKKFRCLDYLRKLLKTAEAFKSLK